MDDLTNILVVIGAIVLLIIEGLFEVTILSVPGALLRYWADGRKKKFKEYYKEKAILNTVLGVLFVFIILAIIILIGRTLASS